MGLLWNISLSLLLMLIIDTISILIDIMARYQVLHFDDINACKGKLISLLNRLSFMTFLFFSLIYFNSLQRLFINVIAKKF